MSAFGGKTDIREQSRRRQLLTLSGLYKFGPLRTSLRRGKFATSGTRAREIPAAILLGSPGKAQSFMYALPLRQEWGLVGRLAILEAA